MYLNTTMPVLKQRAVFHSKKVSCDRQVAKLRDGGCARAALHAFVGVGQVVVG